MSNTSRRIGLYCLIHLILFIGFSGAGAESEFKDTPQFSGMANYKITDASDQELSDYRFDNDNDCRTAEGKKNYRAYTLKEGAKQSSELQISRNNSNSIKSMGGTIIFDGECSGANCQKTVSGGPSL